MEAIGINTLERVRRLIGLSCPRMLALVGVYPRRTAPWRAADERLDPIVVARTRTLEGYYHEWRAYVVSCAEAGQFRSLADLARFLHVDPAWLTRLHQKGLFTYHAGDPINPALIAQMFDNAEAYIADGGNYRDHRYSPISGSFCLWLADAHPEFVLPGALDGLRDEDDVEAEA